MIVTVSDDGTERRQPDSSSVFDAIYKKLAEKGIDIPPQVWMDIEHELYKEHYVLASFEYFGKRMATLEVMRSNAQGKAKQ